MDALCLTVIMYPASTSPGSRKMAMATFAATSGVSA